MQNRVAYYLYRYTLILKSPESRWNVGVVTTVRREGTRQEVGARMTFLQGETHSVLACIHILCTNYKLKNSKKKQQKSHTQRSFQALTKFNRLNIVFMLLITALQ